MSDANQGFAVKPSRGLVFIAVCIVILGLISLSVAVYLLYKHYDVGSWRFSTVNQDKVLQAVGRSRISINDRDLLMRAVMRDRMEGYLSTDPVYLEGKTVNAIIREQKTYEAKQKAEEEARKLAERQAQEEYARKLNAIRSQVTVIMLTKVNHGKDIWNGVYSPYIAITFRITNNSSKTIRGVQGSTKFEDIFGNLIKEVRFSYDDKILKPGESVDYPANLELNEFMDEDKLLYAKALKDLTCEFEPNQIVFEDGEVIRADMPSQSEQP